MIRLLNVESLTLQQFKNNECPPYVILSHRWPEDPSEEAVYEDMAQFHEHRQSPQWKKARSTAKIVGACQKVLEDTSQAIRHIWIDTVCIRQENPMESSTAINSMYRLYSSAVECYVYLSDYLTLKDHTLGQSDWFTRGWTLQELLAPHTVKFYDKDWRYLGERWDLKEHLSNLTGIDPEYLSSFARNASISARMSWMAGRKTTVPEDTAYCLLGLFDVNIPLLYGEGKERAFLRLQEEIMKYSDDQTLFVWMDEEHFFGGTNLGNTGLLARSPDCYCFTGHYLPWFNPENNKPYQMTNKGIAIDLRLRMLRDGNELLEDKFIATLNCHDDGFLDYAGVYLQKSPEGFWSRIWPDNIGRFERLDGGKLTSLYVKNSGGISLEFAIAGELGEKSLAGNLNTAEDLDHQIDDDLARRTLFL
ncbi:MAG: hypothetical protein Q9221_008308 [Calogaya cf. arnoldii]